MVVLLPPDAAAPRVNLPNDRRDPSVMSTTSTVHGIPVADPPLTVQQVIRGANDPLEAWRDQPAVRTVVEFAARQIAAVPWHAYLRKDDNDRQRVADSRAEQRLRNPDRLTPGYTFWRAVATDSLLYDCFCVVVLDDVLTRIPPHLLRLTTDRFGGLVKVEVEVVADEAGVTRQDLTNLPIAISAGWARERGGGISPMTTLRDVLREQRNSIVWRDRQWEDSPKVSGFLKRPAGAPTWDDTKRERFRQSWRNYREGNTGTPILEDGMEYQERGAVKPVDAQDLAGRQLSTAEVASAFHVPPELVGARAGTFSNIAAFRQMLFGPVLGPKLTELQQAVNANIVPYYDDRAALYVELDRESAMNGSFAEQAQVLSTSIGAPWLTPNEGRAKQNLPALEGGDVLVKPLNVTQGAQASPTDSGSQNIDATGDPNAETTVPKSLPVNLVRHAIVKAGSPSRARDTLQANIAAVYARQVEGISAGTPVDAKAFHKQWDSVMAEAVHSHMFGAAAEKAQQVLQHMSAPDGAWSADVMRGYVKAMADTAAGGMNATAVARINDEWPPDPKAPDSPDAKGGLLAALTTVAAVWAVSALTDASGFGASDGARAAGAQTKTWVTGDHPRDSHAAIDGETVGFDEAFSIGVMWPGDASGSADETAGCNCGVEFTA